MRTLLANTKVDVRWYDDSRTILHFIVTGPRGGHKAGFFVHAKGFLAMMERLGIGTKIGEADRRNVEMQYYCECNDDDCWLQVRIPAGEAARFQDEGLLVIVDGCPRGPEPGDELMEERGGYKLYKGGTF